MPAESAREMGRIGWRGLPQNTDRRSACVISPTGFPTMPVAAEACSRRGRSACGVYLPDLVQERPPDLPPGLAPLSLVKKE
jgi:hypothetical protein